MAQSACENLLKVRKEVGFADASALRRAGDSRSETLLRALLAQRHPEDKVLSEESADDGSRLGAHRVWVVDPLDGTREFSEKGRDDFAVHVALVVDGNAVCGAVGLPARGVVYATDRPPSLPPRVSDAPVRLAVSRTRPPALVDALAEAVGGGVLVPMGSAGVKAMAVLSGDVDAYVHGGGIYEWDTAAPVAVALAAGLHASRLDGSALSYNRPDPWMADLVVCRPELVRVLLDALANL